MRIFVTGATGFIGSAVVSELIDAGHQVVGLARSDESADALLAAGAQAHRGRLEDLDSLRAGASASEGVIHLAFIHDDFTKMDRWGEIDRRAIEALGAALEGSERPLVITSGTGVVGPFGSERDTPAGGAGSHRVGGERAALSYASRGVRPSIVRLPPSVHGEGDHAFVPALIGIARERGVSAYIGDGSNRWAAVHRLDAARLFRLALESAPAGTALHGVGDEGVPTREIAEAIGRHLDLPVVSLSLEDGAEHFGWLGGFFAMDLPASSALTQEIMDCEPVQPGLIADLDAGHYFDSQPAAA